ncbi:hypothetical protein N7463_000831 [Penicillium fimorum]|uniref:Uncharacterized protein n=1 Tax=Penicillium fimorum TaxID=1882269 RepID=A0A9X0CC21_9EURO|nr:hypothetical protein N7463_000831 [Penicillium fimorum]
MHEPVLVDPVAVTTGRIIGLIARNAQKHAGKASSHGRLYPRQNPNGFLPIAPRPRPSPSPSGSISGPAGGKPPSTVATKSKTRSESKSGYSTSSASSPGKTPIYHDTMGAEEWSGSEGSSRIELSRQTVSFSGSVMPSFDSSQTLSPGQGGGSASHSAPGSLYEYPVEYPATSGAEAAAALFDPAYSLQPSTMAVSGSQLAHTLPMVSPLEGGSPFDFTLDPALELSDNTLGYLNEADMNMDMEMPVMEEVFHVEDWSRYMWSAETGFEHLDTGFPPVTQ